MKESQLIKGWMNEGKKIGILEARRENLLAVLDVRLSGQVPEDIRLDVARTNDPDTLRRWLLAALRVTSWQEFRAAINDGA